jgi:hypothetical protein
MRDIVWRITKAAVVLLAGLWAVYITVQVWGIRQQVKLTCTYAASAAHNSDRARGLVSDLPYACP